MINIVKKTLSLISAHMILSSLILMHQKLLLKGLKKMNISTWQSRILQNSLQRFRRQVFRLYSDHCMRQKVM